MEQYTTRQMVLQAEMAGRDISHCLVFPSSDFLYLTGLAMPSTQRPVALLLAAGGQPRLVAPAFEAAGLADRLPGLAIEGYTDSQPPLEYLAEKLPRRSTVCVNRGMDAVTLLALQTHRPDTVFCDATPLLAGLRSRKDDAELAAITAAQAMAENALQSLVKGDLRGKTEVEIAAGLRALRLANGMDSAGAGIVASGENSAHPHHHNGQRAVREGDVLLFDIGGVYRGYRADMTRCFSVGEPSAEVRKVYEVVLAAHHAGVAAAKPGVAAGQVDAAARRVIEQAGYGQFFTHRLGHGIGLDVHEAPFLAPGEKTLLRPGNVFSCEPGIYLPGKFGIRIEDLLVMREDGAHSLNQMSKELVCI